MFGHPITEDGVTRLKEYVELTPAEAIQADCDIKAINIILQGLPTEIYALVSQHRVAKDLWEKIKLLMQGTSLTKQERECKLYDEFDKFTYKKGETLHEYYLRFTLLLNDMNIYKMPLEQFQVNTKFLNTLPDEWSKFVTDVKLVKDLHTTNVDQLHAHLQQHERHAIEVRLMHERNPDPLALVASHQLTQPAYQSHLHPHQQSLSQHHVSPYQSSQFVTPYQHQQFSTNQSTPLSITYPTNEYQSTIHHNVYSQQPSIPQLEYAPTTYQQQQPEFSQPDSSLVVPVFQKGDDPIDAINHMMSFLTAVVTSRYPTTNNQLRTSSNPRQQATIYDGKVTVQPVQGRQTTYAAGTTRKYTPGASGSNTGKQRTVICYNCKGEGHIAKQCYDNQAISRLVNYNVLSDNRSGLGCRNIRGLTYHSESTTEADVHTGELSVLRIHLNTRLEIISGRSELGCEDIMGGDVVTQCLDVDMGIDHREWRELFRGRCHRFMMYMESTLKEVVYVATNTKIRIPDGFVDPDSINKVYRLRKALLIKTSSPRPGNEELSTQNSRFLTVLLKDLSGKPVDQTDYHSIIGSLMYLTSSRPDIVQAVCYCARYQARPTEKQPQRGKDLFDT
ncbi:gag-pol polyprotein [Tanacetum coccineum]